MRTLIGIAFVVTIVILWLARDKSMETASSPTPAAERARVKIGDTGYLRFPDGSDGTMYVFTSQDAISKFATLSKEKASYVVLMSYVACSVSSGTEVQVNADITGGFWSGAGHTSDVLVITGPRAGCKGVVPKDWVSNR